MASGDGKDQRNPKDMKALLKFCLEATKDEDAKSEEFAPMDEEVHVLVYINTLIWRQV